MGGETARVGAAMLAEDFGSRATVWMVVGEEEIDAVSCKNRVDDAALPDMIDVDAGEMLPGSTTDSCVLRRII